MIISIAKVHVLLSKVLTIIVFKVINLVLLKINLILLLLKRPVTDLINRIIQVLKEDLYWFRISVQDIELIEPVKL